MEKNLAKTYNPHDFEDRIYEMWEKKGAFRAEVDKDKKPFYHCYAAAEYHRAGAYGACAGPDTAGCFNSLEENAGIQRAVVAGFRPCQHCYRSKGRRKRSETKKAKEKKTFGREEFLKRAWAWKEEYGGRITRQCRKLGIPATGAENASPWTRGPQ